MRSQAGGMVAKGQESKVKARVAVMVAGGLGEGWWVKATGV